ncbi:MAG TPA: hypothetical protein VFH63_02150 [candidate division Zixibacteria bacterium]|nr:hypothetical protein [candidate division Zixibacteria bacterium]
MGPILDLAVVGLAVMVGATLVALAWTLGVAIPAALRRTRTEILGARLALVRLERRLRARGTARVAGQSTPDEGDA